MRWARGPGISPTAFTRAVIVAVVVVSALALSLSEVTKPISAANSLDA